MDDTEPDSRVGSRFGPYELTRLLSRGGVGVVYEAEDTRDQRTVAVKVISEEFSGSAAFRTRVEHGAEAVAKLTEPHVLPVDNHGEIDGLMFLETRLVDGADLATMLERSGPLSPPRAVAIVHQVAAALDAAEDADVAHGAVKPENILVTDDDFAYLADFGVTAATEEAEASRNGDRNGDAGGYRDDVYALARVLTECLTGSPPPVAAVPRPSRLRPGKVPVALDEVVARGLAKNSRDRYGSAGELATAAYEALTRPERHQATRILQRGGSAAPAGTVAAAAHPAPADSTWASRISPVAARGVPERSGRLFPISPGPQFDLDRKRRTIPGLAWLRRHRKRVLVGGAVLVLAAAVGTVGHLLTRPASGPSAASPRQEVLPFTDLNFRLAPGGVALDTGGDVYVTSQGMSGRVVKLAAGSTQPTVLPFGDMYQPQGVVVDSRGNVYFSDFNDRVVRLDAGSDTQTVLPFTGLDDPAGIAVDSNGNVYVADRGNNQVVKLESGSNLQTMLPFAGLRNPGGVAVDGSGGVYVTDTDNNRVLKLAPGSSEPVVMPFNGIAQPWGITVDDGGSVYVTEHLSNKVAKLAAGSVIPTVLPFTGLNTPSDVAVDSSGNVYVADRGNDRVLKLPT